jgi:hypothetical protein
MAKITKAAAAVWIALSILAAGCGKTGEVRPSVLPASGESAASATQGGNTEPAMVLPGTASPASSVGPASPSASASPVPGDKSPAASASSKPIPPGSPEAGTLPATVSPSSEPSKKPPNKPSSDRPSPALSVTISIAGNAEWGTVLAAKKVELRKSDTVAGVLIRTLKASRLSFDVSGSGEMFYVKGIDGLYEFDDGPTSGWKYRINGKEPGLGAGSYELKAGDRVEWFYTSQDQAAEKAGKEQAP